jgi:ribosomal protein S18 acetylase RimI-like enzyme
MMGDLSDAGRSQPGEIVPVADLHVDGYHACLDSVARERLYLGFIEAPALDSIREFVQSNIARDIPQFMALDGETVIGWSDISPSTRPGFTHSRHFGMGVRHDYRGMGIGTRLLRAALDKARANALERIDLEVYASNHRAIELYKKAGFVVEGIKKRGRKLDGVYEDIVFMALLFE